MRMRGFAAAAALAAGVAGFGCKAAAAMPETVFADNLAVAAGNAAAGARTSEIRRRRVIAALSPLVTHAIVQQPERIDAIIRGLMSAAPDVAPVVAEQAMASFPGFAAEIARAAGLKQPQAAVEPVFAPAQPRQTLRIDPAASRAKGHAARVAAWAISAVAKDPGAMEDIMRHAFAAAPGGEATISAAVQTAYPGFAKQIAAAAAPRSIPPRPLVPAPTEAAPVRMASPAAAGQSAAAAQVAPPVAPPAAASAAAPAAPMQSTDTADDFVEIDDPLEPMNRIIFAFNDTVDLILLRPIAIGYNWIMPDPALRAVRRFFLNLDAPVIAVNDLLQGDLSDAGVTLGRFGINTTIGLLGLFDPADSFGLERHHADFGQTLHSHGVGPGPYFVIPLIGPASTRGAAGKVVDIFFQPTTYLLSSTENLAIAAARAVVKREELLDPLDELREGSIDYYTGLKAAFWQARQVDLNKGTLVGLGDGGANKLFDAAN